MSHGKRMKNWNRWADIIERHLDGHYFRIRLDMRWCRWRYGISSREYFKWGVYGMSWFMRRDMLTDSRNRKLWSENSEEVHRLFNNKAAFMRLFHQYTKRDFLDMRNGSFEDFADFVKKHGKVFIKYAEEYGGKGAQTYEYTTEEELRQFYDKLAPENEQFGFIVEEMVVQHPDMYKVGAHSINTIRVTTYLWNDEVHIIACTLRMGGDGCTDNYTSGGSCAAVDIESGIVTTEAWRDIDNHWIRHPYTNTIVPGFQIPHWDKVIEICKQAAKHMPGSVFIGWDVAILEDDVLLIEANNNPGIFQTADKVGKYGVIRRIRQGKRH